MSTSRRAASRLTEIGVAVGARDVEGVEPRVDGTAVDLEASRPLPLVQCRSQLTGDDQVHDVDRGELHGQLRLLGWIDVGHSGQRQSPPAALEASSQLQIRGQGDEQVGAAGEELRVGSRRGPTSCRSWGWPRSRG